MPELPDIDTYLWAMDRDLVGQKLVSLGLANPFVLRTVSPSPTDCADRQLLSVSRMGKRIVFHLEGDLAVVVHLMIAGRLKWRAAGGAKATPKGLAIFTFQTGRLILTEAGKKRRASIHIMSGADDLAQLDPGGLEPLDCSWEQFADTIKSSRHTLKRTLTDPRIFSGIGNAYSDEILHGAGLSPFKIAGQLTDEQCTTLFNTTRKLLSAWRDRLIDQCGSGFPEKVTAFHKDMAVHGKFGEDCPKCGAPVQRIVYASNECNYCPGCQTEGRILADRAMSRLLKDSWPKHLDEL